MRIAHFDPVTGAAGDMIVAALIDAGASLEKLRDGLSSLPVPAFRLDAEEVRVRGFRARRLVVEIPDELTHRHLPDVKRILGGGALPAAVVERAIAVFERLADAEARSHGIARDQVHFHEVGALDAILDVAGACLALELLEVGAVSFSPLRLGTGEVDSAHGRIPVPAPAVLELTRGLPVLRTDIEAELLTPTGAAILTTLGRPAGAELAMIAEATGVGAGTRELPGRPNVLRVSVGVAGSPDLAPGPRETDEVAVLETNLDDMSGELLPAVLEDALSAGALDAWLTPVHMKKGRPGHVLSVLASPADADRLTELLLRQTTSFGVRRRDCRRRKLPRRSGELATPWGSVRVKIGELGDGERRVTPEYESCRAIADRTGRSLLQVYREIDGLIRSSEWVGGGE